MKSEPHGTSTSSVEVADISSTGLRLKLDGRELFLSFDFFPWFRTASVNDILDVRYPSEGHLYWPSLDIDIAVESIDHPERYPLLSSQRTTARPHRRGR